MGTRSRIVFRVKGKVVLQVYLAYDSYPTGHYVRRVAKILLSLVGEVNVYTLIMSLICAIKQEVGCNYIQLMNKPYDVHDWLSYIYVFDFNDILAITVSERSTSETYTIPGFAVRCRAIQEAAGPYIAPTFKFDTPLEGKELIQMIDQDGEPLFFMAAKDWFKKLAHYFLRIDIHRCKLGASYIYAALGVPTDDIKIFGKAASGPTCLAAQILKKTYEVCGEDAFILPDINQNAKPLHTIAFYHSGSEIALHDEDIGGDRKRGRNFFQGIHSHTKSGIVLTTCPLSREPIFSRARRRSRASTPFLAWALGNMRNRDNCEITTVRNLCNVMRLITALAGHTPPRPSIKKRTIQAETGAEKTIKIVAGS